MPGVASDTSRSDASRPAAPDSGEEQRYWLLPAAREIEPGQHPDILFVDLPREVQTPLNSVATNGDCGAAIELAFVPLRSIVLVTIRPETTWRAPTVRLRLSDPPAETTFPLSPEWPAGRDTGIALRAPENTDDRLVAVELADPPTGRVCVIERS